jgi:hypothetical protein
MQTEHRQVAADDLWGETLFSPHVRSGSRCKQAQDRGADPQLIEATTVVETTAPDNAMIY